MKATIKKLLSLALVFCFVFSFSACGGDTAPTTCNHNYVSTTTKQATCKETGIKTYTCTICSNSYTEDIAKLTTHSYTSAVTKEATCKEMGVKTYTCVNCGDSYTQEIDRLRHVYQTNMLGNVIQTTKKEATCINEGLVSRTCTICGPIDEKTPKIDHSISRNGVCYMCGLNCPIALNLTNEQKTIATNIVKCASRNYDNSEGYNIGLILKTDNGESVAIPAVIDITIKNTAGTIIYSCLKKIESSDYAVNQYGELEYLLKIKHTDFSTLDSAIQSIQRYIIIPGYCGFSFFIPQQPIIICSTNLPTIITYKSGFSGDILTKVKINDIKFGVKAGVPNTPQLILSGEKLYDAKGDLYSRDCLIGYKVYDMENNVIDSGTFYTDALAVGDSFSNEKTSLYVPNKGFYRLELLNVG